MAPCYGWRSPHTRGALSPGPASPRGGGSSPHTRGAHTAVSHPAESGRIIPAYAGSTRGAGRRRRRFADHPRIRGEHRHFGALGQRVRGSSPHTRGALARLRTSLLGCRIIPAYAGSTSVLSVELIKCPDHPRIRGEHAVRTYEGALALGSSPHTRGARGRPRVLRRCPGIIPAYAGSTRKPRCTSKSTTDHPRIRGEHPTRVSSTFRTTGSSPHTRGAHDGGWKSPNIARIIPAYAGSTGGLRRDRGVHGDHPRIRGEHQSERGKGRGRSGSSPHTRGARVIVVSLWDAMGIIPAYAGSTRARRCTGPVRGDHPRIRGEHFLTFDAV